MRREIRAMIIRAKILTHKDSLWEFEQNFGRNRAFISRGPWQAAIGGRTTLKMLDEHAEVDRETFLNACRRLSCPHTIDVWVDDAGKVLSLQCDGSRIKPISLARGTWETDYFQLPSPKSKLSPDHIGRVM